MKLERPKTGEIAVTFYFLCEPHTTLTLSPATSAAFWSMAQMHYDGGVVDVIQSALICPLNDIAIGPEDVPRDFRELYCIVTLDGQPHGHFMFSPWQSFRMQLFAQRDHQGSVAAAVEWAINQRSGVKSSPRSNTNPGTLLKHTVWDQFAARN